MEKKLLVIKSTNIYTNGGKTISGYVVIRDGNIASVSESLPCDIPIDIDILEGNWVTPGFVDLHNHGSGGKHSVEEYWLSDYTALNAIKYGTTSTLASLTFSKDQQELTKEIVSVLREKIGKVFPNQTIIEGIHAEGPIIRTKGALPDAMLSSIEDFKSLVDSLPALKVMTISPSLESPNNFERIKYLFEKDVLVALGHDTEVNEDEILDSLRIAYKYNKPVHVTHLFNVTKFHHREISLVNIALLSNYPNLDKYKDIIEPSVEIIGDFIHVHPIVVHHALQTKNLEKVCFITDAIGDHNDKYQHSHPITMNGTRLSITDRGVFLENTTKMAGSCTNQLDIFYNLIGSLKIPIASAIMMLSENPAKFVNLQHIGTIEPGKQGNLLVFDHDMKLKNVILNGNIVTHEISS